MKISLKCQRTIPKKNDTNSLTNFCQAVFYKKFTKRYIQSEENNVIISVKLILWK